MTQAAPKPRRDVASASPSFGNVAAGGPVAMLQRDLAERLAAQADGPTVAESIEERAIQALSRLAGPVLLLGAYGAVLRWWF